MSYTASVITVSDLGSRGLRQDTSGPAVRAMLEDAGFTRLNEHEAWAIVPGGREAHTHWTVLEELRGATLIGKGSEILKKIDRVGRRMWMGQGMCGSLSGSIPTNVGQPRIRVSEITVGGKGGAIE